MRKARVHINYEDWDDYSLATLSGRTLSSMTDNANFPEPRPELTVYRALVNDYREKHEVASKKGSQFEKKAKDNARKALLMAMHELAFYVNTVARGDAEILASSGFELLAPPQSKQYPKVVTNIRLADGRFSGEIKLMFSALKEAYEYEYNYSTVLGADGDPVWGEVHRTSTSRMNYISGLPPGSTCYVRVRARNKKGIGDWSNSVSLIVR